METQEHKRFAVFAYFDYYPSGGIYDIESSFDTEADAIDFAINRPMEDPCDSYTVYVFDFDARKIVWNRRWPKHLD